MLQYSKYFLALLAGSLFLLFATVLTSGVCGLLLLLGDNTAGIIFGWIAAVEGLFFFVLFFLLVFSYIGLNILPVAEKKNELEDE